MGANKSRRVRTVAKSRVNIKANKLNKLRTEAHQSYLSYHFGKR